MKAGHGLPIGPAGSQAARRKASSAMQLAGRQRCSAGLCSAAATAMAMATAREGGEKSNLLHEGFPKLGAPLTVVLVCFAQGVGTYL